MKQILFISAIVLIQSIQLSQADTNCPIDPSKWCSNIKTAKACDTIQQCWNYVWSQKDSAKPELDNKFETVSNRVNLTLYYETLCPDCREFMSGELWKAFQSVNDIMNLTLVPYGNAKETYRSETKLWQFSCQHGSLECWGNLLHSCMLYYYPRTEDHLPFIQCMESDQTDDIKTAAAKCGDKFKINMNELNTCMTSKLGNSLQHENAVLTETLSPAHTYVPWITLNGVHTEEIQNKAQTNLVGLICDTYKGQTKPSGCSQ